MFQNNALLSQLKQQIQKNIPKRQGVVKATDRGYGFLETDKGKRFFIPPAEMKNVLNGDRIDVLIRENGDKSTAEPVSLKKSSMTTLIARLTFKNNKVTLIPSDSLIKGFFKIKGAQSLKEQGYQEGDWVRAELLTHPLQLDDQKKTNKGRGFLTQVTEKIAHANDPFAYRLIAVATHKLPNKAPEFDHPWEVIDPELPRRDLTDIPFLTIDGINTQDMDDALYIGKNDRGWALTVAISDAAAYVPEGTEIDKEASERAFTLYLPNFNIPMLPRNLSDSLCSLKEGEKRATLCCKIQINHDGSITEDLDVFAAWIVSHHRLNYCDVSNFLEHDDHWHPSTELAAQLNTLNEATQKRFDHRSACNITFKNAPDYTLKLNNKGEVYEVLCEPRRTANRLVEESMIAANICMGDFLAKHKQQGVFNTHSGIATDRLETAVKLLAEYNIDSDKETLTTLDGYIAMRQKAAALSDSYLDHRLRKLLAYADTSHLPAAHFTLGVDHYATWTSPIRKYGDMLNHRLIKSILLNNDAVTIPENISENLSEARRKQRFAERDVNNLLYSQHLVDQVGSSWRFKAEIFDIIKAGVRVRVQENGATFFIPATLLTEKTADAKKLECNRELGKVIFNQQTELQLGDIIEVKLHSIKETTNQLIGQLADPISVTE
ncbi:MAG TPA: exoribonuclease II [Psychromonas hadalis]|nr:exoribonuclease II [Psychromonas hadalis]